MAEPPISAREQRMPAPGLRITIRRAVTGLSANFKLIGNGGFRPVAAVSVPYPRKKRLTVGLRLALRRA